MNGRQFVIPTMILPSLITTQTTKIIAPTSIAKKTDNIINLNISEKYHFFCPPFQENNRKLYEKVTDNVMCPISHQNGNQSVPHCNPKPQMIPKIYQPPTKYSYNLEPQRGDPNEVPPPLYAA